MKGTDPTDDVSEGNIKVCIRLRPFNNREIASNSTRVVNFLDENTVQLKHPETDKEWKFAYDKLFWSFDNTKNELATQEYIFKDIGLELIKHAFDGYNATLIAYGQTSSGKTHTIIGPNYSDSIPKAEWLKREGLVPRICREIFHRVAELDKGRRVEDYFPDGLDEKNSTLSSPMTTLVYFRMLEIYKEKVKDLLNPQLKNIKVSITNDDNMKRNIFISAPMQVVRSYEEIDFYIEKGNKEKQVAQTKMNDRSSRSHTIFQIRIEQPAPGNKKRVSILNLVDLAGSENAKQAATSGDTLKEGAAINKSLSALGQVIDELVAAQTKKKSEKSQFVSYRNSVLTSILANSLGGNAKTIMLCTISPSAYCVNATKSTLRYGQKTQMVKNKATVNEDSNVKLIRELRANIEMLKKQIGDGVNSVDLESYRRQLEESRLIQQRLEMTNFEEKERAQFLIEEMKQRLLTAEEQICDQQSLIDKLRAQINVGKQNARTQTILKKEALTDFEVEVTDSKDEDVHSSENSQSSSSVEENSESGDEQSDESSTDSSNTSTSSFDEFEIEDDFENTILNWSQEEIENATNVPIDIDGTDYQIENPFEVKTPSDEPICVDSISVELKNEGTLPESTPSEGYDQVATPSENHDQVSIVSSNSGHRDEPFEPSVTSDVSSLEDPEQEILNSFAHALFVDSIAMKVEVKALESELKIKEDVILSLRNDYMDKDNKLLHASQELDDLKNQLRCKNEVLQQKDEEINQLNELIASQKQLVVDESEKMKQELSSILKQNRLMETELEENRREAVVAMEELKEKFGISANELDVVKKKKKDKRKPCSIM